MSINWPRRNLPDGATNWARKIEETIDRLVRTSAQEAESTNQNNRTTNSTNRTLQEQVQDISANVTLLNALSTVQYAEFVSSISGFTGYYAGTRPEVRLSTPTGKIDIQYGGALNGGDGYFVYSVFNADTGVVYIDRAAVFGNPAQRVAVSGGASFAPSGFRNAISTVPANTPLAVRLELNTNSTYTNFFGGSILVRPAP